MMIVKDALHRAGDPNHPNEDAIAFSLKNRVAVVVDGLTSKEPNRNSFRYLGYDRRPSLFGRQSDVGYIAKSLACRLAHGPERHKDPVLALNALRTGLLKAFRHAALHMPGQQAEFPMCALAMARWDHETLEITRVGDAEAGVAFQDRAAEECFIGPDEKHAYLEKLRMAEAARLTDQEGIMDKMEQRRRILPLMTGHYNDYTNRPGGFGMFSINRDLIPGNVCTIRLPVSQVKEVRLYTDGLSKWYDCSPDARGQRYIRGTPSLREMFSEVRAFEHQCVANAWKSFRKSDDATGLILENRI